jgi:hypothetical protein
MSYVRKVARDAQTGRIIPIEKARQDPARTVVEKVKYPGKKK